MASPFKVERVKGEKMAAPFKGEKMKKVKRWLRLVLVDSSARQLVNQYSYWFNSIAL